MLTLHPKRQQMYKVGSISMATAATLNASPPIDQRNSMENPTHVLKCLCFKECEDQSQPCIGKTIHTVTRARESLNLTSFGRT